MVLNWILFGYIILFSIFSLFFLIGYIIEKIKDLPTFDKEIFHKMKNLVRSFQSTDEIDYPDFDLAVAHVYLINHMFSGFTKDMWNENLDMVTREKRSYDHGIMKNHAIVKRLRDSEIQKKLSILEVSNQNYFDFIERVDNDKLFLYVDPPYWDTETHYRHGNFSKEDHINLLNILKNTKCKWMLSYYDFDILHDILPQEDYIWKRRKYSKISGRPGNDNPKKKDQSDEIIIMNYNHNEELKEFEAKNKSRLEKLGFF